jgi:hypothetical protein
VVTPSISWFVREQKDADIVKEFAIDLGYNVQLAFYERLDAEKWMWKLAECSPAVSSIHLPKGLELDDYNANGLVKELSDIYDTKRFVVHPWSKDLFEIAEFVRMAEWTLSFECFSRKGSANPFLLLARFGDQLIEDHLGLCVDFSHLENDLATIGFIKGLLPYTKMLHVSNRLGKQQHLPLFMQTADTNAHRILSQILLVPEFPVKDIVLEFMPEYKDKLGKQYIWLNSYVQQKRRKFNG